MSTKETHVISGVVRDPPDEERGELTVVSRSVSRAAQLDYVTYVLLPAVLLLVTLLGGLRLSPDNAFVFLRPSLACLVFAAMAMLLYVRADLISISGWFSESNRLSQNMAHGTIAIVMFTATAQVFNALLPEQGLPFWVVGFCFFWTLWNNLFAAFEARRLLRSLMALFGLAFVVKYLVLANLAAAGGSWMQRIVEAPGREALTWLLDLPRYAAGTGYIQFFCVLGYMLGLFLVPRTKTRVKDAPI
jgi:hypothetical protein